MQALYESIMTILQGDQALAALIGATSEDPRIYKTSVQYHTQAANTGIRWVTVNTINDLPEEAEQTHDVRRIEFVVHSWAREDSSEGVEAITAAARKLLDFANLARPNLLAWFCAWVGNTIPLFEAETKVWHQQSRYECMVMAVGG